MANLKQERLGNYKDSDIIKKIEDVLNNNKDIFNVYLYSKGNKHTIGDIFTIKYNPLTEEEKQRRLLYKEAQKQVKYDKWVAIAKKEKLNLVPNKDESSLDFSRRVRSKINEAKVLLRTETKRKNKELKLANRKAKLLAKLKELDKA